MVGGRLYLASRTTLDVYDVAQNRWSSGRPLDRDQSFGGGDALKAKFYVVGGYQVRATSEYVPATDRWRARAQIPEAFTGDAFVRATRIVVDGKARLAILGGLGHHWQWTP